MVMLYNYIRGFKILSFGGDILFQSMRGADCGIGTGSIVSMIVVERLGPCKYLTGWKSAKKWFSCILFRPNVSLLKY